MKIAFFHELPVGGARRAVNEIAKQLKEKHLVDLYLVDEKFSKKEKKYFNHSFFYRFTPKTWKGKNWKVRLYKDTIELFQLFRLHEKIAKQIRKKNYDFLFINASKFTQAPFILRFNNSIKIYYCHDPHYRIIYESILKIPKNINSFKYVYEKINRYMRKIIDKINMEKADLIFANSNYTKIQFGKVYKKESLVCYLGVDEIFFKPYQVKKEIDILFIGSYEEVDGYYFLEKILKKMTIKPKVRILAIEKEWISDDYKLRNLYRKSKIVVCFTHNEPFGLVPLEAMACGVPIVAVNEAGYKESIIDNKTGFLISRNVEIAAKKIEFLLTHEDYLVKFGKEARKNIIKNWTWKENVKKIENILLKSLSNNS